MSLEDLYFASNKQIQKSFYNGLSKLIADHSRLNIDGSPAMYNVKGRLFTLKDTSRYNIDTIPKKYHD